MEIYLIAQSGVIASIYIYPYTHITRIQPSIYSLAYLYAVHCKTKLNRKHCLKFMWSIDNGLAIENERKEVKAVRKTDNVFIDLLVNFKNIWGTYSTSEWIELIKTEYGLSKIKNKWTFADEIPCC